MDKYGIQPLAEITQDRYWHLLEVLPPSKWNTVNGVESFHVCEVISHREEGAIVTWCASYNDRYFEFQDVSHLDKQVIAQRVQNFK